METTRQRPRHGDQDQQHLLGMRYSRSKAARSYLGMHARLGCSSASRSQEEGNIDLGSAMYRQGHEHQRPASPVVDRMIDLSVSSPISLSLCARARARACVYFCSISSRPSGEEKEQFMPRGEDGRKVIYRSVKHLLDENELQERNPSACLRPRWLSSAI